MCFSIQVDKNINKLSDHFKAQIRPGKMLELDRLFRLQAEMESKEFDDLLGLKHSPKKRQAPFKLPQDDGRVFSNYFTNIIVSENKERIITPMRYRVRPEGSREEIPSKFNVFNARIDSLEIRPTWKSLFMRTHGIVPLTKFYEWVEGPDKKTKLISFFPAQFEMMWAPVLYDEWISKDGRIHFKSFAIITDGPNKEIEEMGHDRCPIFLDHARIDDWLNPTGKSKKEIYDILNQREKVFYKHEWVAS
jgi:putative SOS response-associated peptidase YedK